MLAHQKPNFVNFKWVNSKPEQSDQKQKEN